MSELQFLEVLADLRKIFVPELGLEHVTEPAQALGSEELLVFLGNCSQAAQLTREHLEDIDSSMKHSCGVVYRAPERVLAFKIYCLNAEVIYFTDRTLRLDTVA